MSVTTQGPLLASASASPLAKGAAPPIVGFISPLAGWHFRKGARRLRRHDVANVHAHRIVIPFLHVVWANGVELETLFVRSMAYPPRAPVRDVQSRSACTHFFGKFGSAFTSLSCFVCRSLCAEMKRIH